MHGVGRRLVRVRGGGLLHRLRVGGGQELAERHRSDVQIPDAADGHREAVVGERELQQRSGGRHRQIRPVLVEIAQGGQRVRRRLHLIQKEHRAVEPHAAERLQLPQDAHRIQTLEHPVEVEMPLQVHLAQSEPGRRGELPDEGRLPDLPCAAQHQRLATRRLQPTVQRLFRESLHVLTDV